MPAENAALFQGLGPNELGPDVAIACAKRRAREVRHAS